MEMFMACGSRGEGGVWETLSPLGVHLGQEESSLSYTEP